MKNGYDTNIPHYPTNLYILHHIWKMQKGYCCYLERGQVGQQSKEILELFKRVPVEAISENFVRPDDQQAALFNFTIHWTSEYPPRSSP